jgi:hypothetical protein
MTTSPIFAEAFQAHRESPPSYTSVGIDTLRTHLLARSVVAPGLPALLFFLASSGAHAEVNQVGDYQRLWLFHLNCPQLITELEVRSHGYYGSTRNLTRSCSCAEHPVGIPRCGKRSSPKELSNAYSECQ